MHPVVLPRWGPDPTVPKVPTVTLTHRRLDGTQRVEREIRCQVDIDTAFEIPGVQLPEHFYLVQHDGSTVIQQPDGHLQFHYDKDDFVPRNMDDGLEGHIVYWHSDPRVISCLNWTDGFGTPFISFFDSERKIPCEPFSGNF